MRRVKRRGGGAVRPGNARTRTGVDPSSFWDPADPRSLGRIGIPIMYCSSRSSHVRSADAHSHSGSSMTIR